MTHQNSRLHPKFRGKIPFNWRVLIAAGFILALITCALPGLNSTRASNPTGGTINPTATTPVTWTGTAEQAEHSTRRWADRRRGFVPGRSHLRHLYFTVGGTTADWSGKLIHIKIEWLLPVTDYDLYIHKDSNSGPVVGNSGRGATSPTEPLTWEDTTIDPAIQRHWRLHDSRGLLRRHRCRSISRQREPSRTNPRHSQRPRHPTKLLRVITNYPGAARTGQFGRRADDRRQLGSRAMRCL